MRRTLSALLAALVLLGVLGSSAWAAQSGQGESAPPGQAGTPEEAKDPEEVTDPEEPADPEELTDPEEPADPEESKDPNAGGDGEGQEEAASPSLEELRDTLFAILGGEEETRAVREQVDRMIALGDPDGSVREWLELTIRKYRTEEELRKLAGQLDSLEGEDEALRSAAQAMEELAQEPDALLVSIEALSPDAAAVLEGLAPEALEPLREQLADLLAYDDGSPAGRSFASLRLLLTIRDSGLLDGAGAEDARSAAAEELNRLAAMCSASAGGERERLERASRALAGRANLAQAYSPARLIPVGAELNCRHPLFTYNGAVMLSVPDAAAFLGGELVQDGDVLAILAPGTVLELVKGSSDSYLNDKLCKLAAPVLNFDGVCYLPLDTALRCRGMERLTAEGYELLYFPAGQGKTAENGGD